MSQQNRPVKLTLPYRDDSIISPDPFHERDTAKVMAVFPLKEQKERKKRSLVEIAIIVFAAMIAMMSLYTFFIVCVTLFKIFIHIVIGG